MFGPTNEVVAGCTCQRHASVSARSRGLSVGNSVPALSQVSGMTRPHNGRFDFLGFEFYWEPDRQGKPRVKRRTATKKWRAGVQRMTDWVKAHRHQKLSQIDENA